ncbi:MAG TPA: hypothetical protein VGG71_06650 [Chitinophagaceae bacterium]
MNLLSVAGIIASISLFIPIIIIIVFGLFYNRSFLALAANYLIVGIHNLMIQDVIVTTKGVAQSVGIVCDLLDAPLMLIFLIFFRISSKTTKQIFNTLFIFLGFEVVTLLLFGFSVKAVEIILGPDTILILVLSFIFCIRNVRLAITNSKALGKAVMASSVFVSYAIFSLVYVFYFLLRNPQYQEGARLLYYLVTLLSALLMSAGIVIENKRIKKLGELKNTRRELAAIYGEKKISSSDKNSGFFDIRSN